MRGLALLIVFLLSAVPPSMADPASPADPSDFQYYLDFTEPVRKNILYQVHLPVEVLQKCAPDCRDMRLFDQDHREVPYVILDNESPHERFETYALEIVKFEEGKGASVMTLKLPEKYRPISVIELDIADRDFLKEAVLDGSRDRKAWTQLARDTLYDFSSQVDLRKTKIEFAKSDYRYYRMKLVDARRAGNDSSSIRLRYEGLDFSVDRLKDKRLRIHKVMGSTTSKTDRKVVTDEAVLTAFSENINKEGNTEIILEANLPAGKISFEISNPYYYRKVAVYTSETGKEDSYRLLTQGPVYSFPLSGIIETKNTLEPQASKHRYYKFVIWNQNNPPLKIGRIRFEWARKHFYFMALTDTGRYSLYFGNEEVSQPSYDLSNFVRQDNWFEQKYEALQASHPRSNNQYTPSLSKDKKARIEKAVLTAIVILLVLGMGYWLYRLAGKALKQEGV